MVNYASEQLAHLIAWHDNSQVDSCKVPRVALQSEQLHSVVLSVCIFLSGTSMNCQWQYSDEQHKDFNLAMALAIRGKSCECASLLTFLLGMTIHEQHSSQIRVAMLFPRTFCNRPEPVKFLKMADRDSDTPLFGPERRRKRGADSNDDIPLF